MSPTEVPTPYPTIFPTEVPTPYPTLSPTEVPTQYPTLFPTQVPTQYPTVAPTQYPTDAPTQYPTDAPTSYLTEAPSSSDYIVTNCEGYLTFNQLPHNWCNMLSNWAICGIADGVIRGSGYGCRYISTGVNFCYAKDSGDLCTQFVSAVPTPSPFPIPNPSPVATPTHFPTIKVPTPIVLNCEGYLNYHELPSDWCENLTPAAVCGIADGIIFAESYGCYLWPNQTGACTRDSNDECTQFLRESDLESEGTETGDVEGAENLLVVFIIIPVLYVLGCCLLCWKMSRSDKSNEWNLEGGGQQRIDNGQVTGSSGMSVLLKQSVEDAVEMVQPTPGDATVAPPTNYEMPPPKYEAPPPNYEAPPPYCETQTQL